MKRLLLTGAAIVLTAGAAMAADMSVPFKAAPAMIAPYYNWTGCYLGIHGGGAAFRDAVAGTWSDGGIFGGQIGCNYQIDHLVVGVEGEGAWSGVSSSQTALGPGPGALPTTINFKNEWTGDVAARFGLAYDRFFIYEKIGVMWADHRVNATSPTAMVTGSETMPALFWGLGLEYGLTPQWTAKVETDFAYFGATNMNQACTAVAVAGCGGPGLAPGAGIISENSIAIFTKIGVNYRF